MPRLPPRKRPYLYRRAKKPRIDEPPSPPQCPNPCITTSATQPPTPPPLPQSRSLLLNLPGDIFSRIIAILQNGTHLRGPVLQTARNAFPLALLSTAALERYRRSLHTIDAAANTERDSGSPALLKEALPPHLRNLVTIAGPYLKTLRLPRYDNSQIGAEAILPVIDRCTTLSHLSFVDCGRVDRDLCNKIFATTLQVIQIEKPSVQIVKALAKSGARLRVVKLWDIPFSATDNVMHLLKSGHDIKQLSLRFDGRSMKVVEDSAEKACQSSPMGELQRFLQVTCESISSWLPEVEEIEVTCSHERELDHARIHAGDMLTKGLGDVTTRVNSLREKTAPLETSIRVVSLCWRSLNAIPYLPKSGEVRVRLPGYEFRYPVRGIVSRPSIWHFQMTLVRHVDLWGLSAGIDTLNIGDEVMVRAYERFREDVLEIVANAKGLRRLIVRVGLGAIDVGLAVLEYVSDVLKTAPWVREMEIGHEVLQYHDKPAFTEWLQSMEHVKILHLSAPVKNWKPKIGSMIRHLPGVLRRVGEFCKDLSEIYCERIGGRIMPGNKREELIRKLGETDVVIDRLANVDCSSVRAMVVCWIEQVKHS